MVNDGSDRETTDFCQWLFNSKKINVLIHNQASSGFSQACNMGIAVSLDCGYVCLLNSDTVVVTPHWLTEVTTYGNCNDDIGVLGVLSNAATYQSVGMPSVPLHKVRQYGRNLIAPLAGRKPVEVDLVNGFAYFIKRAALNKVGLLDVNTFPHYGSEDDYSLRVKSVGLKLVIVNSVYIYHHGSQSYGMDEKNKMCLKYWNILKSKWGNTLELACQNTTQATAYLREIKP